MIKSIRQNGVTILVIFVIMITNVVAYFNFDAKVKSDLDTQTQEHIATIVEDTVEFFNLKMEKRIASIEALALFIGTFDNWDDENILTALSAQSEAEGYSDYDIIDTEGKSFHKVDYADNKSFKKAVEGNSVVKETTDEFGEINGVDYYVPITYGGTITGVLLIRTNLEQFTDFIDFSELSNLGNIFIVKKDGTLLSKGDGLDEVSNITQILSDEEAVAKKLISSMKVRNAGNVSIGGENNKKYFGYGKSEYNNWYVVSLISSKAVESKTGDINNEGRVFFTQIAFMFVVLILYFIYTLISFDRVSKVNKRRYFVMSDQLDNVVFDYSVKRNRLYCSNKWEEIFGYKIETEDPREDMFKYIYEEDKEKFKQYIAELKNGQEKIETNIRIINDKEAPIDCHIKMFAIKARKGKMEKLIGVLEKNEIETENNTKENEA